FGLGWDGSSLQGDGICDQDSVTFTITNIGSQMLAPGGVSIVEDNIMQIVNTNISLGPGQSQSWRVAGSGSTWLMKVYNNPSHPFVNEFGVVVEGCGVNAQGGITTGNANDISSQIDSATVSIDCQANRSGAARMGKEAVPVGLFNSHSISRTDEIEYYIRYRHDGTDTVGKVTIVDTLSPFLDPQSLVPGVGSHPYDYALLGGNIAVFNFQNLVLPPSRYDSLGSIILIKFRIAQMPNNQNGDTIWNWGGISLDGNLNFRSTDSTFHTIGDTLLFLWTEKPTPKSYILTYPNPFEDEVRFILGEQGFRDVKLEVYGLDGKLVRRVEEDFARELVMPRNDLKRGLYVFRVTSEGRNIG
ncbi:MAG: T9SS type A sorting domain-containing protein, partial [Bacteroidota bacterium]